MTFTIDFFNKISDFGEDWSITGIEIKQEIKEVYIDLRYTNTKYYDPDTEEELKLYDHAPERHWRHTDLWDFKTYVRCRIPRVKKNNGKVRNIRFGWSGGHDRHTYSFENRVINTLYATKNQTKTSELLNCSFRLVNRIIHSCTARGISRRKLNDYGFTHLSIDEKSFKKGHKYVTVLSHPRSGCVLEVSEGRDYTSDEGLLTELLTAEQRLGINTISMDMWKAYIKAAKQLLPNSEIVHDKFHLIKYLNEAIDKVRKREVKENEVLINSRYSLLKNEENRTTKQQEIFKAVMSSNLEVTTAYYARETFKTLFDKHNDDRIAMDNLKAWATNFFTTNIKELKPVVLRMLSHSRGVVNAMISNFNNAMAERLNGKIQEIKLSARGYRTFENFRSAILFFHGNLNVYPLKW